MLCPDCAFVSPPPPPPPGPTVRFACVSGPDTGRQILIGGQAVPIGDAAEVAFQHGQFCFAEAAS